MSIHLEPKNLINAQQMEVAVHGPDGATHLILCTGIADLGLVGKGTYTFLIGPQFSRRQFVGVIASGALSTISLNGNNPSADHPGIEIETNLILLQAEFDDESSHVRVSAEVSANTMIKLAISYQVSILAELPNC